jgi:hypothetical protein
MTHPLSNPPEGSCFVLEQTPEGLYRISWKMPNLGCARYGVAAFLAFWLCGWAVGEFFAIGALTGLWGGVAKAQPGDMCGSLFLIGWLGGWTLGGAFAIFALVNMLRPARPEAVTLGVEDVIHDPGSGLTSWQPRQDSSHAAPMPTTGFRAKPRTISREQLQTLRLERVGERQRLTVDCGADRIEIGPALREPEREWLHQVLQTWAGGK